MQPQPLPKPRIQYLSNIQHHHPLTHRFIIRLNKVHTILSHLRQVGGCLEPCRNTHHHLLVVVHPKVHQHHHYFLGPPPNNQHHHSISELSRKDMAHIQIPCQVIVWITVLHSLCRTRTAQFGENDQCSSNYHFLKCPRSCPMAALLLQHAPIPLISPQCSRLPIRPPTLLPTPLYLSLPHPGDIHPDHPTCIPTKHHRNHHTAHLIPTHHHHITIHTRASIILPHLLDRQFRQPPLTRDQMVLIYSSSTFQTTLQTWICTDCSVNTVAC
mmetsp:Transcript_29396/g.41636  ORF Transcript_29396/g.41636 Transcript_29396/m.41636 type:complete len:270 (+) Transcript_29396:506-1315(+)